MLFETFLEVSALHVMEAARVAAVVAGEDSTFGIQLAAEGVAAALGKDFEAFGFGMVAPDLLAHGLGDGLFVEAWTQNARGDRAALTGVEPAIRAPTQAVHDRMRVFEAESGKEDLGITVRNIVVVAIGIEEQVGRVENKHAAATAHRGGDDVQAFNEGRMPVEM